MPPISAGDLEVFLTGQQAEVCVSLSCPCLDYYYGYRDDLVMHAASTMKIPVMIEVYRQAEKGIISLDDSLAIKIYSVVSLMDLNTALMPARTVKANYTG